MFYLKRLYLRTTLFSTFVLFLPAVFSLRVFEVKTSGFALFLLGIAFVGSGILAVVNYLFLKKADQDIRILSAIMEGSIGSRAQVQFNTDLVGHHLKKEVCERAQI